MHSGDGEIEFRNVELKLCIEAEELTRSHDDQLFFETEFQLSSESTWVPDPYLLGERGEKEFGKVIRVSDLIETDAWTRGNRWRERREEKREERKDGKRFQAT